MASTAHAAGPPAAASAGSGAKSIIVLDAMPLAAASPAAAAAAAPDIGRPTHGHTGKPARHKHKRKHTHRRLTPRQIARSMLRYFGWRPRQFKYLNALWNRESSWNVYAFNPYSGAYGVPQAVPGSKMASAGPNWRTSARTQVRWGLGYIRDRYGSPRSAWDHELSVGWY